MFDDANSDNVHWCHVFDVWFPCILFKIVYVSD